jgi:signal transduction histidine kinase
VLIQGGRELFGVLEADSTTERDYDDADIAFVQSAANLLGVALDRQRYEEERDHLLNVASHELGNPLALVLGFGERLRHQLESDSPDLERLRVCAEEILQGATRMRRLLEQLLDLGRIEQPHAAVIEPIDLDTVLHRVAAEAEQRYPSVRFEWSEEPLPSVMGNLDAAYMLFANLVENAAKYSRLEPLVELFIERAEENCVVRVRDRCGGIVGDDLDRLFDRYFRGHAATEFRGLGLGLFVAHRAAESLGWWVNVQNYAGVGCEFVVTIPTAAPESRGPQASQLPRLR